MKGVQELRRPFRSEDLERMGFEGEGYRGAAGRLCTFNDLSKDGLMAKVHAVEVTQGENGGGKFLAAVLDAPDDPHTRRDIRTLGSFCQRYGAEKLLTIK